MTNKPKGILIGVACVAVFLISLSSIIRSVIIKYAGDRITATVTEVPFDCDRYNHIKVLLGGVQHEVSISRTDCKEGSYETGQKVELLKHGRYDELVWPESHPELVLLIVFAFLLYLYSTVTKYYSNKTKDAP